MEYFGAFFGIVSFKDGTFQFVDEIKQPKSQIHSKGIYRLRNPFKQLIHDYVVFEDICEDILKSVTVYLKEAADEGHELSKQTLQLTTDMLSTVVDRDFPMDYKFAFLSTYMTKLTLIVEKAKSEDRSEALLGNVLIDLAITRDR